MYCPVCRCEYREGFTVCSDCQVELVSELPPEPEAEYQEFVNVLSTHDQNIVAVVKSLFESNGIRCFIEGENIQRLMAVGPIRVNVSPEDEEAARALLEDVEEVESCEGEDGVLP